jgi:hypothetical protein
MCGCSPRYIVEYIEGAQRENLKRLVLGQPPLTPNEYMMQTDPTWDKEANKFCCSWCYTVGKMMAERGWPGNGRIL